MESPVIVEGRICCQEEDARRFLGLDSADCDNYWRETRPAIKKIGRNWYAYSDLVDYVTQRKAVRDKGDKPSHGKARELLLKSVEGGRKKKSS